jgi:hypothetical protein
MSILDSKAAKTIQLLGAGKIECIGMTYKEMA